MKTSTDASGFTLVELLVVVATTAMLVALVLPALAMSKDTGQGTRCLGNLRQLTTAWMVYTSDNQGRLVPNGNETDQPLSLTDPNGLPGGRLAQWCPGRQDEVTAANGPQLSPANASVNVGDEWIESGLLYPYVGNVSAYHCPADTGSIIAQGFGAKAIYPHVRSVSMNAWLRPLSPFAGVNNVELYDKSSDLVRPGPAQLFVFIDENPLSISCASFVCAPGVENWISFPATYHNAGSGLSFADGHAEIKRWTDQTLLTFSSAEIQQGESPELAPDQSPPRDLTFLQNASSYVK